MQHPRLQAYPRHRENQRSFDLNSCLIPTFVSRIEK
jgi:hypothetical protein